MLKAASQCDRPTPRTAGSVQSAAEHAESHNVQATNAIPDTSASDTDVRLCRVDILYTIIVLHWLSKNALCRQATHLYVLGFNQIRADQLSFANIQLLCEIAVAHSLIFQTAISDLTGSCPFFVSHLSHLLFSKQAWLGRKSPAHTCDLRNKKSL